MPFGTLDAEFIEVKVKKPKQAKQKIKKPEIKKPEIKMPEVKEPEVKKPEIQLPETPPVPLVTKHAADTMNVTILSRNAAAELDLLTGLYFNTGAEVSEVGLSLYADTRTLSVLQTNKRKLSGSFMAGEINYIQSDLSEGIPTVITLILSPAGGQNRGIKVNFTIRSFSTGFAGSEDGDVIWAIADAPIYEGADSYASALTSALSGAAANGKPIFVLMTEFEKYGKVSNIGGVYKAERHVIRQLMPLAEALSPDSMVLPIQLYGGLAYRRADGHSLIFGENESGGMLAYKPEGCHIPLLFSLEEVNGSDKWLDDEIIKSVQQINQPQRLALSDEIR